MYTIILLFKFKIKKTILTLAQARTCGACSNLAHNISINSPSFPVLSIWTTNVSKAQGEKCKKKKLKQMKS